MRKNDYLLRTQYESFLKKLVTKDTCNDYLTKSFCHGNESIPNEVATFIDNDEPIYAYSIIENLCKNAKGNIKSWLRMYFKFIRVVDRLVVKNSILANCTGSL